MRKIKKTDYEIMISENNQNQVLETFISIKFDAECNETTPAILFLRFHEDFSIYTKKASKGWPRRTQIVEIEKKQGQIWNQRPLKRWGQP